MREVILRIRVLEGSPDAALIRWIREQPQGKSLALAALRAYWLASSCSDPVAAQRVAMECWNALIQQGYYLSMTYGFQTQPIIPSSTKTMSVSPSEVSTPSTETPRLEKLMGSTTSPLEASTPATETSSLEELMDHIFI